MSKEKEDYLKHIIETIKKEVPKMPPELGVTVVHHPPYEGLFNGISDKELLEIENSRKAHERIEKELCILNGEMKEMKWVCLNVFGMTENEYYAVIYTSYAFFKSSSENKEAVNGG